MERLSMSNMLNPFHWQPILFPGQLILCLFLGIVHLSHSLKCYQCTSLEGFESTHPNCLKNPGAVGLLDGFAGCLQINGMADNGKELVVRAGYYNKQEEGRVPSCFHQESVFKVESHIEIIKFDSLNSCLACDHADGCNSAEKVAIGQDHKLLLTFSIILYIFVTYSFVSS